MVSPSEAYHSYVDHGICPYCKKEDAMLGRVLCFDCWKEKKELYNWYKSIGLCPRCRRENAAEGHVNCATCLKQVSEYMKRKRKRRKK